MTKKAFLYNDRFFLFPEGIYDGESGGFYLDGKRLSLSDPWHPLNEIFAFDVSEFKSFNIWHDWDRDE